MAHSVKLSGAAASSSVSSVVAAKSMKDQREAAAEARLYSRTAQFAPTSKPQTMVQKLIIFIALVPVRQG